MIEPPDTLTNSHSGKPSQLKPEPNQNAYIKSFNGCLRDECLNENWFVSLVHAKAVSRHGGANTTRSARRNRWMACRLWLTQARWPENWLHCPRTLKLSFTENRGDSCISPKKNSLLRMQRSNFIC